MLNKINMANAEEQKVVLILALKPLQTMFLTFQILLLHQTKQ